MKKILYIIVISLLSAAVLLCCKYSFAPMLMKNANYGVNALINKGSVDNLFIGSSMFRQGINTDKLFLEGDSYNLCFNGNQPWQEYMQLKELVDNSVDIKKVYIDMYSGTICQNVAFSDVRCIQGVSFEFASNLYKEMNKGSIGKNNAFQYFVSANNEIFATFPISFRLINSRYSNGNATGSSAGQTLENLESISTGIHADEDVINAVQLEYIKKMIQICDENGISVCFIETPKYIRVYEVNDNYKRIMTDYINSVLDFDCQVICCERTYQTNNNSKIVNYAFRNEEPGYFQDIIHLSSDGREALVEVLGNVLR